MTTTKKYNLSPLPEQRDDYSQYEESVARWDRIIPVLLVLLLLVAGVIYLLVDSEQPQKESQIQVISQVEQEAMLPKESVIPEKAEPSKLATGVLEPEVPEPISKTAQETETEGVELKQKPQENLSNTEPSIGGTFEKEPTHTAVVVTEVLSTEPQESARSQIHIHQKGITQALLTLDSKSMQAKSDGFDAAPLSETVTLPESGIIKVILLTEMAQLKGTKLFHDWYLEGVRQARVKIPVNVDPQYSASSKFINYQMTGNWQVKVVDESEAVYLEAQFKVITDS